MDRSDAELVRAARRGDPSCFGLLYERHYRMAVGIARSRLTDVHMAEDAAQEAFAVACGSLVTLRDPDRFAEWLGTICRRTASRLAARPAHEPLPADAERVCDPERRAIRDQVNDALDLLDERARKIVVLHYFSGLTHDEIARALGLSAAGVHGRLQRARAKLAKTLDPSGNRT